MEVKVAGDGSHAAICFAEGGSKTSGGRPEFTQEVASAHELRPHLRTAEFGEMGVRPGVSAHRVTGGDLGFDEAGVSSSKPTNHEEGGVRVVPPKNGE